jgi:hypothetical protein
MKKFLDSLKKLGTPVLAIFCLGVGFFFGWIVRPDSKSMLQEEMDKKVKVLTEKKKVVKELEDCKTVRDGKITELSTCASARDKCFSDYDERGKLLADNGAEMALLYDSLGQVMEASSPEQAHELFCVTQQGGKFENGKCTCDGEWDGAICVNSQTVARQKICEMSNGTWQAKKCACGQGMMFSEKGCIKRPYPPTAQKVIASLEKRLRDTEGSKDFYQKSFGVCKKAHAKPPKLTVKGAKVVSCTPGACPSP